MLLLFGLQNIGNGWIIIILAIILFFGGRKIPEMMRGLGQGMKEFKDATKGEDLSKDNKDK
ncbi:MAG: twin-arginine translocase TatA/TatE family subunit [Crocinitomicaceae bacterium]|nr:twin-arginine translocase TatA/TatE family subunit [Crocinitomicaceae bacterium]|tara:strand:- start:41 stop:223 length:183 start_codon:yes stop_codon:yes gene_type:complete